MAENTSRSENSTDDGSGAPELPCDAASFAEGTETSDAGAGAGAGATAAAGAAAADAAGIVTINVKTLNGPDFELAVSRNVLVSELKSRVRERTDVDEVRGGRVFSRRGGAGKRRRRGAGGGAVGGCKAAGGRGRVFFSTSSLLIDLLTRA